MTTSPQCDDLVAKYLDFLAGDFEITPLQDAHRGCYVVTPFVRPDGEAVELELMLLPNGKIRLSDMGDTLSYLYVNGLTLTQTTLDQIRLIARRHRIAFGRGYLAVECEDGLTGDAVHRVIQAAIEASSLTQSRRGGARVNFDSEVESFIIQSGVVYDVDYRIAGRLESHTFKFHVNSGRNLLIQPITAPREATAHSWAERWAYRFGDTTAKNPDLHPIAVLDDRGNRERVWTEHARAPVSETAILWGYRGSLQEMLAL